MLRSVHIVFLPLPPLYSHHVSQGFLCLGCCAAASGTIFSITDPPMFDISSRSTRSSITTTISTTTDIILGA